MQNIVKGTVSLIIMITFLTPTVIVNSFALKYTQKEKNFSDYNLASHVYPTSDTNWNTVALFFNLPFGTRPSGYKHTSQADALEFLDEGSNPAEITISDFIKNYWKTISYNNIAPGVNTPRELGSNDPIVPEISIGSAWGGDPYDWVGIINTCIDLNAEAIWIAAGGLIEGSKRWIPSVFLIQNYPVQASAFFAGYTRTVGGKDYLIGDVTHIPYKLDFTDFEDTPQSPDNYGRQIWGTLCHEFGHNFLEYWDFYGPTGCTGYWDLLGDNSPPGRMSEVSSFCKERIGWITFKQVIEGPSYPLTTIELLPYTTSGEAIKVIPDPVYNPYEYFLLEYRKSTGSELWRPDGGLKEEGLLITHINERLGVPHSWLMREAPFFDVEYADYSDNGTTLWTGHTKLKGALYPQSDRKDAFTPFTLPSSNFYGGRSSGLYITDIETTTNTCRFKLKIEGDPKVGWRSSNKDRCVAGYFTPQSHETGQELFMRNDKDVALMVYREGQWLVEQVQHNWIGSWHLGEKDYEIVGDFDGDGLDEIYIRSPTWLGMIEWDADSNEFVSKDVRNLIAVWAGVILRFGLLNGVIMIFEEINDASSSKHREFVADVDGDGKDEIIVCGSNYLGFIDYTTKLVLKDIALNWIGEWHLGKDDKRYRGRFSQENCDDILLRSNEYIGLVSWNGHGFILRSIQNDRISSWDLTGNDKHAVGDFDGDGYDEIYIRNQNNAGVIKWDIASSLFKLQWIKEENLDPMDDRWDRIGQIHMEADDVSYVGKFVREPSLVRDGILHRNQTTLAVLTWEPNQQQYTGMRIRQKITFPAQSGHDGPTRDLDSYDRFILGDFHGIGKDRADPRVDCIGDNLTDVFVYNPSGQNTPNAGPFSTTIGINYVEWNPMGRPGDIHEDIGIIWFNKLPGNNFEEFIYRR